MDSKIRELTEQVYKEGVARGDEEARKIIAAAEEKAAAILADARAKAEAAVADAQKRCEELRRTVESELALVGRQAMGALRQQILDMICAKVIDESVTRTFADTEAVRDFVKTMLQNWKGDAAQGGIEVLLPEAKRNEIEKAFRASAGALLGKGVSIKGAAAMRSGFQIGPAGGKYKISCTDEDFAEFFKGFLRPRTRTLLFGN